METAFFLAMGWCGTKYPGWWKPYPVPPRPQPEPWRNYGIIGLGVIAGIAGGTLFSDAILDNQYFAGQNAIAAGLFAFGSSNIVTGIAGAFRK